MKSQIFFSFAIVLASSFLNAKYSWEVQFPSLPAFSNPVELVHAYDGTNRFFVVQQRGIIYVFENEPDVTIRKVFIDLSDRVSQSGSEMGLLGLAFHPAYPDSPYFYVNYTDSSAGTLRSHLARYCVSSENPDSALHNSEIIFLTITQPFTNHNGGKLAFGPDGYLYIGFGDGGSGNDPGNRAQNRTTLLGKILRINVDSAATGLNYSIPPSNPYFENGSGYREEIFAYGIRNPWKFSFDSFQGTLWLGDVGQGQREEVDTVIIGGNYGWRLMEGFICTPGVNPACQDTSGLLLPVWDYLHGGSGKSITGGYVYRGSSIPSLYGAYIFADYITGETWAFANDTVVPLSNESFLISTFGVDTSENIYLCSYSGSNGRIYKLTSEEPVPVELASFTARASEKEVLLEWRTATELNNYGFEIERRTIPLLSLQESDGWKTIGFVAGSGTSSILKEYSFVDRNGSGKRWYRLKQIDNDGAFKYSGTTEVSNPLSYALGQNFPNPFNPSTRITFTLPGERHVLLAVYDVLGRKVSVLANGQFQEGVHSVPWDASRYASGMYTAKIVVTNDQGQLQYSTQRKLLLMK